MPATTRARDSADSIGDSKLKYGPALLRSSSLRRCIASDGMYSGHEGTVVKTVCTSKKGEHKEEEKVQMPDC